MTDTTTTTNLERGAIHHITETRTLANGDHHETTVEALILDITTDGNQIHLLWTPMRGIGDDYLPDNLPALTTFGPDPLGGYDWSQPTSTTLGGGRPEQVRIGNRVGTYKARDEHYNGVPVLAEQARNTVRQHDEWSSHPGTLRRELRQTVKRLNELPEQRDNLIRRALAAGVPVAKLAADSGLSEARIYQIRDGRR